MEVQLMNFNAQIDHRDPLPMIAARFLKLRSFEVYHNCEANLNWPLFFQKAGHRLQSLAFHPSQMSDLDHLRRHCVNLKELVLKYEEEGK